MSDKSVGTDQAREIKLAIAAEGTLRNKHGVACDHGADALSLQR